MQNHRDHRGMHTEVTESYFSVTSVGISSVSSVVWIYLLRYKFLSE